MQGMNEVPTYLWLSGSRWLFAAADIFLEEISLTIFFVVPLFHQP